MVRFWGVVVVEVGNVGNVVGLIGDFFGRFCGVL